MKVVITSATEKEILQVKQSLNPLPTPGSKKLTIQFHTSGVGILASCFSIAKMIAEERPDLIIQAGIAGTFNAQTVLGKVVAVREELIGDAGVEEQGNFKDLGDLQLQHPDIFPFTSGTLVNKNITHWNVLKLDEVRAITVNEISTRSARIQQYKEKYNPETESMEGGSLHYCCIQTATPFIQIRAVSNYVGDRDKSNWNFKDSLNNLTVTVVSYIEELQKFYN